MDSLPQRPDAPEPTPEPPKELSIGKYGQRITQSGKDKLYNRMIIDRGRGVYEHINLNKYTGKADSIENSGGKWIIERQGKFAVRAKNESTGEVKEIKKYGGIIHLGNEPLGGDTSWLD